MTNGCACGSRTCTCDEAKGGCFCEKLNVAEGAVSDIQIPDAAPDTGSEASTEHEANAAGSAAGASSELGIRKTEHKCMDEAHKAGDESAILKAIKACESATLASSKASGLYKEEADSSASGVSKAGKE